MIDPIGLYNQILHITKAEQKSLDNNDFDTLLQQIEERERLLEETKKIDFTAIDESRKSSIRQLLDEIKTIDENNIMRIELIKNNVKDDISETVEKKKVQKYIANYSKIQKGMQG